MKSVPTSINTDDPFIFNVMLSDEYWKVASTLNWNVEELIDYMEGVEDQILDSSKIVHNRIQSSLEVFRNSLQFLIVFNCFLQSSILVLGETIIRDAEFGMNSSDTTRELNLEMKDDNRKTLTGIISKKEFMSLPYEKSE